MKIAQALRKHAEMRARINLLEERIKKDFIKTEGKITSYSEADFNKLVDELKGLRGNSYRLKVAIDAANGVEVDGKSVALVLTDRNKVTQELAFWTELRNMDAERYVIREGIKSEKRILDSELDRVIDNLTNDRRRLDDVICYLNATVEVSGAW